MLMYPGDPQISSKGNGRILRPGNLNKEIEIIRYVTKRSFDAYVWQILETKQIIICQLYSGGKEVRSMSDLDNTTLNFGEIKAIATDNKEIMEKFKVDMRVQELKLKERSYRSQKYNYDDRINYTLPRKIELAEKNMKDFIGDCKVKNQNLTKEFCIELNNKVFKDKKEAGAEIIKSIHSGIENDILDEIGKYRGFKICLENHYEQNFIHIIGSRKYTVDVSKIPSLNIDRIDEQLDSLEHRIEKCKQEIEEYKREIEQCKIEIEKPFADEQELKLLLQRQSELNNKLNLDKKEESQIVIEDEVEFAEVDEPVEENCENEEYEELENCEDFENNSYPDIEDDMYDY